jgi:hypothetical protein
MARLRELFVLAMCICVLIVPVSSAAPAIVGTVTTADRALVGTAAASTGTTVFGGDQITTDSNGSVQIRAGGARFLLSGASSALLGDETGIPNATLYRGTALFSTANAKAFLLRAAQAEIRPASDSPTVAQVSILGARELLVRSKRGAISITFEGETKVLPEGSSYKVVLQGDEDAIPSAAAQPPQGARGAGSKRAGGPPIRAGSNHFVLIATTATAVATFFAVYEALQSPDRP